MLKDRVIERFSQEFGHPDRVRLKVTSFNAAGLGIVVQTDQPNREDAAFVWLPYPPDDQPVPEIALEYAGDSGRHSGTYASAGLEKGQPALKLILSSDAELNDVVSYIKAFAAKATLPSVSAAPVLTTSIEVSGEGMRFPVDINGMPAPKPVAPRREAISRAVQREVWQRDGGACVERGVRKLLCFDHIVPFSLGGSNTVRNLQLLCEPCNLSKGNRI
ncbi:HNH endonuclease [Pseudomonas sp. B21-053]|uniref:HNH endonuclease n=1 Tax=Pseudomonas sp. B21-053 TaxID=2895493 RepID=UPI00222E4B5D|nr:HNH endonuclease signature motif containing protein [Pseudomonas sp. B21-053]UZE14319.1 HNH endonuclease [Pseudomonas sp. B21-053]